MVLLKQKHLLLGYVETETIFSEEQLALCGQFLCISVQLSRQELEFVVTASRSEVFLSPFFSKKVLGIFQMTTCSFSTREHTLQSSKV